jgi:hypothetical protein
MTAACHSDVKVEDNLLQGKASISFVAYRCYFSLLEGNVTHLTVHLSTFLLRNYGRVNMTSTLILGFTYGGTHLQQLYAYKINIKIIKLHYAYIIYLNINLNVHFT